MIKLDFFYQASASRPTLAAVRPPVILLKVYKLLKVIGAENELSTRELLVKALNMLFELYGKPPMAE